MVPKSGEFFHLILLKRIIVYAPISCILVPNINFCYSAPMSFFSATDTGTTLNRLSQDLQLIDMDLPVSALNTSAGEFVFSKIDWMKTL